MFNYQQKKQIRKIIYSKITLIVLLIFIIILLKACYGIYRKQEISRQNLKIIKEEYDSLNSRKEILESEIEELNTEDGVEREIRSKFNVSRPGEIIINIIDNEKISVDDIKDKDGFWNKILSKFR